MNRIAITILSAALCTNVSANKFRHNHFEPLNSHMDSAKQLPEAEDFSGTWTGVCYNNSLSLKIVQSEYFIKTTFSYQDGDVDEDTSRINSLTTDSINSSGDSQAGVNLVLLKGNTLTLKTKGLIITYPQDPYGGGGSGWYEMNLEIIKEGKTLRLNDALNSSSCVLTLED